MAEQGIADVYVGTTNDSESSLSASDIRHISTAQEVTIKPKVNSDSAYALNRKIDAATAFDSADITLGIYDVDAAMQAYLLSEVQPTEGGVVDTAEDEADYRCLFYKTPLRRKRTGKIHVTRYGWLYKVQLHPWDTTMKTLAGKPDLSNAPSLAGTAQATDFSYLDADGVTRHPWRYFVDDDDPACPSDIATSWCQYLHIPGVERTAPTVSTSPADEATAVQESADIVWTFSKALDSSKVNPGNFVVLKSDGTAVAGTLSLDSTKKIVTFAPSTSLTAGTYIAVATQNITDSFGIPLAAASIINFTVS